MSSTSPCVFAGVEQDTCTIAPERRRDPPLPAPDGLALLDGQILQSLTSFAPFDEVASEILDRRFF
jgi:hypothetical protein